MSEPSLTDPATPPASDEGGGGGFDPASIADTPVSDLITDEALRTDPSLVDFKGIEGLARSYVNTKKLVGGDASQFLRMPTEDSSDEERTDFYTKLGRPAEAKEYTEPEFENRESLMIDDEAVEGFRSVAHEAGLSNTQFNKVLEYYFGWANGAMESTAEAQNQSREQALENLQRDWGDAFDDNMELAKAAIREYGDDDLTELLETSGLGNHPAMIKLALKLGEGLKEDEQRDFGERPGGFGQRLTPTQAQGEIRRLQGDPEFQAKYFNDQHPQHDDAVKQMARLHQQANPA